MAKELLQSISKNENERAKFRARRKFQMDNEHNLIVARDEGRDEGRDEERKIWESVVAEKDAEISDKNVKIAEKDTEINKLREQLKKQNELV